MASPPSTQPSQTEVLLERGQTIDRFVVLGLVGRGGMGEVYAAYDPELDRKVAIKLLRARGVAADGRTRLLREAQAIAKLSHPNVVVVYDVGTFADSVFIAMEFIEGRTVSGWMHADARSQRDILQVFLAAGRGLAAAHAAGLVHRDFKPDNVMVTNDGQVRVMDFGLARQTTDAEALAPATPARDAAAPGADGSGDVAETFDPNVDPDATINLGKRGTGDIQSTSSKYLSVKLTQTGAMMGTPAYMAPEQFGMKATDGRTDQFSFCVALYEMLYGGRPFAGDSFITLMTSVLTGAVAAAPAKSRVPGWLRKVLLRGLEVDPERRYPSMTALLAALETDPTVRIRRVALGVAVLVGLGIAVLGMRRVSGTQAALCRGGAARWSGVWEANGAPSARKETIHRAFAATGRGFAEKAFANTSRLLDDYVAKWLAMYTDACEATHVRGEQSADVLDLRMGCLQERLTNAGGLSELLSRADGATVDNALSAAGGLPRLERCADVASLKALVKPPDDPAVRARVDDLRKELARVSAHRWAGHCAQARGLADDLLIHVRETRYLPLLADTLIDAGLLGDMCSAPTALSMARFKEAFTTALAARYDEAAAGAAIVLGGFTADRVGHLQEGRDWLAMGRAELQRFDNHPLLDAWLLNSEAALLYIEGRGPEAVDLNRKALAAKQRILDRDHPDILMSRMMLGNALALAGRFPEALTTFDDARAAQVRLYGPTGGALAAIESNRAEVLNSLKRYREAHEGFQHALDLWAVAGIDPVTQAYALTGLGLSALGEGHPLDAVEPLERAVKARLEHDAGAEHLGESRFGLARALWARPRERPRALALARQSRASIAGIDTPAAKDAVTKIDAWLAAPAARF